MQGGNDLEKTGRRIVEFLMSKNAFIHIDDIIKMCELQSIAGSSTVRSSCKGLTHAKIIEETGERQKESYIISIRDEEQIEKAIKDLFGIGEDVPETVKNYYKQYGFNELVKSVSKQINHEDVTVREFDEDRLWIGRYIDFLNKAKEYVAWQESDQAIAKKKIAEMRKQIKTQ